MTRNHYSTDTTGLLEAIEAAIPDPMVRLGNHPELMAIHPTNRQLVARLLLLLDLCAALAEAICDNAIQHESAVPASVRDQVQRHANQINLAIADAMDWPRSEALPGPAALTHGHRMPTHLDAVEFTPSTVPLFQ